VRRSRRFFTGLSVRHLNSHQHLHMLPAIFGLVEKLAADYGVGYVRIVDEAAQASSRMRRWSIAVLSHLGRAARARARVRTNDGTIGVTAAGHLTSVEDLVGMLDGVVGTTEIVCHPGLGGPSLGEAYEWGYAWEEETATLCDPRLRSAIEKKGIALIAPPALGT
jgi:predicted glycoside hydrolase/deacetylase ChbG (UPF0249 family)